MSGQINFPAGVRLGKERLLPVVAWLSYTTWMETGFIRCDGRAVLYSTYRRHCTYSTVRTVVS